MQFDNPAHFARALHQAWKNGHLGGEVMPEDAKPAELARKGEDLLRYLTLPMALNYQRNSYKLWEAATQAWNDEATRWVFEPQAVVDKPFEELQAALGLHRVALQPNKHPQTWRKICESLCASSQGQFETLLSFHDFDISRLKQHIQVDAKKGFPYLAGAKICNYWLYVLTQYTDYPFRNRAAITIAPDTHVMQASLRIGLVSEQDMLRADAASITALKWATLLADSGLDPIDMHTPLWLWSRSGFPLIG